VNVLILSSGGGGGNILRSLKALFKRDLSVTQKTDARYAERLRRAVTTRFLDTNEFSLTDVPKEERLVIGDVTTRRLGSMHNPELANQALDESRPEVEALLSRHSVVIVIGTGGKGTGAGTIFPIAQLARQQRKLVIPIFVRPSFERHEVEKRRYDHALRVGERFDAAGIRLIEILNDRGYRDADPEPQPVVWERMNLPVARGLRGLLYVLWDLSQVDPSDLSILFAGHGRLRIGFSEIDPPTGREPNDDEIQSAAHGCWQNPFCAFDGPVGTSLVCIQGNWSNVVDGKIKGKLAALAARQAVDGPYNPLYARALHAPRPWGVTALFAEYTGNHSPLEIDWSAERRMPTRLSQASDVDDIPIVPNALEDDVVLASSQRVATAEANVEARAADVTPGPVVPAGDATPIPSFATIWDFARAVNRSDPAALAIAANGVDSEIAMDGPELRKLLSTFWFRSVFPRLSKDWQDRILNVMVADAAITDHIIGTGRRAMHLRDMTHEERQRMLNDPSVPDAARADLQLMVTVGAMWGPETLKRFQFTPGPVAETSRIGMLLQPFRH
jgi:cell division GTPase FtsZ